MKFILNFCVLFFCENKPKIAFKAVFFGELKGLFLGNLRMYRVDIDLIKINPFILRFLNYSFPLTTNICK